jgi:hypothetical protein
LAVTGKGFSLTPEVKFSKFSKHLLNIFSALEGKEIWGWQFFCRLVEFGKVVLKVLSKWSKTGLKGRPCRKDSISEKAPKRDEEGVLDGMER